MKSDLKQWDRELLFLQRELENYLKSIGSQEHKPPSSHVQTNAMAIKNELESSIAKIQALVRKPSPYLSPQGESIFQSVKIFSERVHELGKAYWILLDRLLWAKLVVCQLSGNSSRSLTGASIEFCRKKIKSLIHLRNAQKLSLTRLATLKTKLDGDFEYLELARLNREATEFQAPFLLNKARRLIFNAVHN